MAKVLVSAQLLESEYLKSAVSAFGFKMHTPVLHTISTYTLTVEGEDAPIDDNLYHMLISSDEIKFVPHNG